MATRTQSFFRPSAYRAYLEFYGWKHTDTSIGLPDLVRAIKRARPGTVWFAKFTIFGYPLNPMNTSAAFGLKTIEGFYQGIAVDYFLKGKIVNHGVPIPIKRVLIHRRNGGTYRVFASTFALISKWDNDEGFYVPFRGGYARATFENGEIVITDDKPIPITKLTTRGIVLRNELFQVVYDFYRLGIDPPKKIGHFNIDNKRGPLKNLIKNIEILQGDLLYYFVPPDTGDIDVKDHKQLINKLLRLKLLDYKEMIGGHGYQGYGVLVNYMVSDTKKRVPPENVLFARYGEQYVALRPLPKDTIDDKWIVWGGDRHFSALRLNPPYYNPSYRGKNLVNHYLPGIILRDIPPIEWEVM